MNPKLHASFIRIQRQSGAVNTRTLVILLGVLVLALIAAYFVFLRSPATPEGVVVPVTTPEERGDVARDLIQEIRSNPAGVDFAEAHEQARRYQAEGRLADAQLLFFFAARGSYAPAAFDLATMYDPNHFSSEISLMPKPNPSQAYKWYKVARDGGNVSAAERLEELKAWVEKAANDGDPEAERLLLQWE